MGERKIFSNKKEKNLFLFPEKMIKRRKSAEEKDLYNDVVVVVKHFKSKVKYFYIKNEFYKFARLISCT